MSDYVDPDVRQEASYAVQAYEARLGRPMTAVERAAVDYECAVIERKETLHALWLAGLTEFERRRMGIGP